MRMLNQWVVSWMLFMTIWAFGTMGYDKRQAKRKGRRVAERNLWLLALLGGGIGAYAGMLLFRHKTLHTSFRIGFFLLALLDGAILIFGMGWVKDFL